MKFSAFAICSLTFLLSGALAYPTEAEVHCRTGPGTNYAIKKTYKKNEAVSVTCQIAGDNISGDSLWDKTSDGCYVADYYIKTGTVGYVTGKCPSSGGSGGLINVNAGVLN